MIDPLGVIGVVLADKFRVERLLGEGGYGVVYAGTHLVLGAPIAVKLLKVDLQSSDASRIADEYLREARILFSLSHPAIVRMYDVGALERRGAHIPWVVLELLTGPTLEQEIATRRQHGRHFSGAELREMFEPVLEGLAFAHERGILHRDLQPSNIVLSRAPSGKLEPKLLDFGTARSLTSVFESAVGKTGFTPLYGAPEQWDPKIGPPSPATDVYALALTLAEAATLEKTNRAEDGLPAIVSAIMSGANVPSLAAKRPDLPAALQALLARALAVQPAHRFRDGAELRAVFAAALSANAVSPHAMTAMPVAAPPPPPPPPPGALAATAPPLTATVPATPSAHGSIVAIVLVTMVLLIVIAAGGLGAALYFGTPGRGAATPPPHAISPANVRSSDEFDRADAVGVVQRGQPAVEACAQKSTRFEGTIDVVIEVSTRDGRVVGTDCHAIPKGNPKTADLCACLQGVTPAWHFKPPKSDMPPNLNLPLSLVVEESQTLHVNYTEAR